MHTQSNGQSRIIAYGVNPVSGNYIPLSANADGSQNVTIVSPIPLPVEIQSPVPLPVSVERVVSQTISFAFNPGGVSATWIVYPDGLRNVRVSSLIFSSTNGGVTFAKLFLARNALPSVGMPPDLQYRVGANANAIITQGDAMVLQGGMYVTVESAVGNFAGTGISGSGAVIMNLIYDVVEP